MKRIRAKATIAVAVTAAAGGILLTGCGSRQSAADPVPILRQAGAVTSDSGGAIPDPFGGSDICINLINGCFRGLTEQFPGPNGAQVNVDTFSNQGNYESEIQNPVWGTPVVVIPGKLAVIELLTGTGTSPSPDQIAARVNGQVVTN
jgi:hypothetical protein